MRTTALSALSARGRGGGLQPRGVSTKSQRSVHNLSGRGHEASSYAPRDCFAVTDDGYDASQYGYRVFVPMIATGSATVRHSSTVTRKLSGALVDDYDDYYNAHHANLLSMHPRSLDILSSPEVLEILHSQREWDRNIGEDDGTSGVASAVDDQYFSDCEEMQDSWEDCNLGGETSDDSFDAVVSLDEKEM